MIYWYFIFYINDRKINVTVNKLNLLFIKLSFVSWFYSRGDTKGEICIKKKKLMLAFCISWGSSLMQYARQYITRQQNKGVYKILDIPCSTKTVNLILISTSGKFIRNYFCACSSNIKTYLVPFALFHTWCLNAYKVFDKHILMLQKMKRLLSFNRGLWCQKLHNMIW